MARSASSRDGRGSFGSGRTEQNGVGRGLASSDISKSLGRTETREARDQERAHEFTLVNLAALVRAFKEEDRDVDLERVAGGRPHQVAAVHGAGCRVEGAAAGVFEALP